MNLKSQFCLYLETDGRTYKDWMKPTLKTVFNWRIKDFLSVTWLFKCNLKTEVKTEVFECNLTF